MSLCAEEPEDSKTEGLRDRTKLFLFIFVLHLVCSDFRCNANEPIRCLDDALTLEKKKLPCRFHLRNIRRKKDLILRDRSAVWSFLKGVLEKDFFRAEIDQYQNPQAEVLCNLNKR